MTKPSAPVLFVVTVLSVVTIVYSQNSQIKPKQDQDQPIQLQTELIEVHAVVTDKQGHIVRDLKKDDFEILENKNRQEISFFSTDSVGAASVSTSSSSSSGKTVGVN